MSLLGPDRKILRTEPNERPSRWAWYSCQGTPKNPGCGHRTKQLRGLPEVAHNCPKTKTMRVLKPEEA